MACLATTPTLDIVCVVLIFSVYMMTKSALIHLGSDEVMIFWVQSTFLERNNLEQTLPPVLHTLYDSGARDVRVIEWPGSFFNIRVGTLLLNAMQSLTPETMTFRVIQKDILFQWLYDQWHIPHHSVLFIGQRKNARFYDHEQHAYETLPYATMTDQTTDYIIDQTQQVFLPGTQITFIRKNGPSVVRWWQEIDLTSAPREVTENITPYYGIQPLTH